MPAPLRGTTLQDFGLWIIRRYHRFRVTGDSMLPSLTPGMEVLIDPEAYRYQLPSPGDIVVARHPQQPDLLIIKRVESVMPDGNCHLQGDNLVASSDSRQFGYVSPNLLQGKVICTFP
ncbi:MAG: nickel-type superoxide dismutase maturation protease [Cyanobacteria bacterium P01_H01_bin.58]